jgi:hypothetical protein
MFVLHGAKRSRFGGARNGATGFDGIADFVEAGGVADGVATPWPGASAGCSTCVSFGGCATDALGAGAANALAVGGAGAITSGGGTAAARFEFAAFLSIAAGEDCQ